MARRYSMEDRIMSDEIARPGDMSDEEAEVDFTPGKPRVHGRQVPMAGPPTGDGLAGLQPRIDALRAAVRGDDAWRYPDLVDAEEINEAAPMPIEYQAAHDFLSAIFGPDGYTPDAVGQL